MRSMLLAIVLFQAGLHGCSSDALEPKAKRYGSTSTKALPSQKPKNFLFASSIELNGASVSVDFVALRSALVVEANKLLGDRIIGGDCGSNSWSLFASTFFNFSQIFLLEDDVFEYEDDMVCDGDSCSFSSAPPDFSDKGWQDFLSEMLRRLTKAGVDILSADKLSVDPQKVVRYLAGP